MTAITRPVPPLHTATPDIAATIVRRAAEAYLAAYFLFASGAVDLLIYGAGQAGGFEDRGAGNGVVQAIAISIALPAILFCFLRAGTALRVAARAWPYLLLLALAGASVMWSVAPGISLRRFIALALNLPIALYFAFAIRRDDTLRALSIVSLAICVVSALTIPIGGLRFDPTKGRIVLVAIFTAKTASGIFFAVASMIFFGTACLYPRRSRSRWFWLGCMAFALVELVLSNSRTPLVAAIAALAGCWIALFVFAPTGWQRRLAFTLRSGVATLIVLFAVIILPAVAAVILLLIGRDLTLTGRVGLWTYAIDKGWAQPWLGAGLRAFWTDTLTLDLLVLHAHWSEGATTEAMTSNAHNGYLDIWLELGFAGLVLFAIFWIAYLVKALHRIAQDGVAAAWYLAIWVMMTVYYLANSTVFDHDEVSWFIAVFAFVSLCATEIGAMPGSRAAGRAARRVY